MFIILFGLLGVAALLEIGRSELGVSTRQDRAIACGLSGLADVRIRRMHAPGNWYAWYDASNPYPGWVAAETALRPPGWTPTLGWAQAPVNEIQLSHYQNYVIDPLYIGHYLAEIPPGDQTPTDIARFPYTAGAPLYMGRCAYAITPTAMSLPFFDRIFTWADDILFDLPKDPQQRPTRLVDATGIGQPEGYYSWLATVCPAVTEAGTPVADRSLYEVSVVVFYQRDFTPPSVAAATGVLKPGERLVGVTLLGGGWGGGDVRLSADSVGSAARQPEYLDVRENDWILLAGNAAARRMFRWYRVTAVTGDVALLDPSQSPSSSNPWTRLVTLSGPDWPAGLGIDTDGDGVANLPPQGVLLTGVVGVTSRVMQLDQ
jgi:hypothetical protein